ncbi:hypothetical protein V6N13_049817 [Hibiscus sabdariffa]
MQLLGSSLICSQAPSIQEHLSNEKSNGDERIDHEGPEEGRSPATTGGSQSSPGNAVEQIAASRIQKAFRAYRARKAVRRLRDAGRFNVLIQGNTVKKQTTSTLGYLHSWCNVQSQIRARRICMVTEGRLKQKRMENQMKLEAKLHELEWRANASQYLGHASYGVGKENWGWSWIERWIAARPWEVRVQSQPIHPRKTNGRQASKSEKEMKNSTPTKPGLPNGKVASKIKNGATTDG